MTLTHVAEHLAVELSLSGYIKAGYTIAFQNALFLTTNQNIDNKRKCNCALD